MTQKLSRSRFSFFRKKRNKKKGKGGMLAPVHVESSVSGAYDHARKVRRIVEVGLGGGTLGLAMVVGLTGFGAVGAYCTLLYTYSVGCLGVLSLHYALEAKTSPEIRELACCLPTVVVTCFVLSWLVASELLVRTGALAEVFSDHTGIMTGVVLLLVSSVVTHTYNEAATSGAAGLAWLSLLVPTDAAHTHAPVLVTAARVLCIYVALFFTLRWTDGRPGQLKPGASARDLILIVLTCLRVSFRAVAQLAWVLIVPINLLSLLPFLLAWDVYSRRALLSRTQGV